MEYSCELLSVYNVVWSVNLSEQMVRHALHVMVPTTTYSTVTDVGTENHINFPILISGTRQLHNTDCQEVLSLPQAEY